MCCLSLWNVFKFTCLSLIWIQNNVSAGLGYKKLGCYNDNWQEDRPLPHLLFTDRDELSAVYSGKKYIKENFDRPYLDDIVGRCASKCEELGYDVFGIEKFAECWSGDGAYETYKQDGPSRRCFTSKYEPCNFECEDEPCAGTDHAIFVYKLEQQTSPAPPATKPTEYTQPTSPVSNLPSRATPKKTLSSSVATKPKQIKSVKPTTSWLPSRTRTNAKTKPTDPWTRGISSRPTRLPSTRRTLPTAKTSPITKTSKTPRCGMEHIPIHLNCPAQCQTSCTAVCPAACCVATPLYPPTVHSPPVFPLPVYQCPYLCSSACGPRYPFKCCKAAFYIKRKDILRKIKRHKLHRGRYDLLHLKRLVKKTKGMSNVTHTRGRENILTNEVYE